MKKFLCASLILACLNVFAGNETNSAAASFPTSANSRKFTYVIVHGAWGGGWDWKTVADLLTVQGNEVYRPTLTGLGERSHLASTNIDLGLHIQDIVNLIVWENLHDVILVGHSYGGMVITGVADRVPDRIKHLVYIDALLPQNGESVDQIRVHKAGDAPDVAGFLVPAWLTANTPPPHDVPQPAKTFLEPITLTNQAAAQNIPATYILTVDKGRPPEQDDFYKFYLRAQARGWATKIMEGNHVVERSHPDVVAHLLEIAPDQVGK
jgi:pimeloyl-ACP methyl ester carboxylesterase